MLIAMRRGFLTVLTLALTGAVLAGSAWALTHAEYVAKVNPICKKGGREINRAIKNLEPSGDPLFDAYRAGRVFAKVLGRTTNRIADVKPAPEDAALVKSWIDGLRQQKRLIDRSLAAAKRGQLAKSQTLGRKAARVEKRNARKARQLGLPACAGDSG